MPSATDNQYNGVSYGLEGPQLYPVDITGWDDGDWARPIFRETNPVEINEPWPYRFKKGDNAWVRGSDGKWYLGKVVGGAMQGKTRFGTYGLWWWIEFVMAGRVRKWAAPLNGDVKPDTEYTRQTLLTCK